MEMTRTLPTDRNGNVYYGPKTFAAAQAQIAEGADATKVADMMERAGYRAVAAKVRKHYGL